MALGVRWFMLNYVGLVGFDADLLLIRQDTDSSR